MRITLTLKPEATTVFLAVAAASYRGVPPAIVCRIVLMQAIREMHTKTMNKASTERLQMTLPKVARKKGKRAIR